LAAATGFWSRLGIRFKWFSIKSVRPFNMDDISGFVSWILVGHVIWIIVGTTTFFSLAILTVNTVFAQETLAEWVGNYLTESSGLRVVFESAIVPKWKDGVITLSNVFVSRRPGQGRSSVTKGSQAEAAAAAAELSGKSVYDDGNYSQFDISIETANVTLSFAKWFNGKGLLRDVEVKGLRGVIDRTHVKALAPDVDPRTYRREHHAGDFELDSFKMEDVLVTVHQPNGFRPFSISIFSCDLPKLRQQWFFYDFMSANNMSGSIDNSLFTLHPRQVHNFNGRNNGSEDEGPWKKQTRFRIDGLNIDHLNRGVEGPFSWIREGNVDISADINLPMDDDESVAKVISDVIDRVEAVVTSKSVPSGKTGSDTLRSEPHISTDPISEAASSAQADGRRHVAIDLRLHMNDVRAAVPIFTKDISYVNNALIRPIVAYINSRRSFIPINCRVVKGQLEFDGSWSMWECGLMDDLNMEVRESTDATKHF
jgi:distribution and morphology protein 31